MPSSVAAAAGEKAAVNSTLGTAPTTEDFVKEVADCDVPQSDAAKLAQQKGDTDEHYAEDGDNPRLKNWAGKTLAALQHHLEMVQALNDTANDIGKGPLQVGLFATAAC